MGYIIKKEVGLAAFDIMQALQTSNGDKTLQGHNWSVTKSVGYDNLNMHRIICRMLF